MMPNDKPLSDESKYQEGVEQVEREDGPSKAGTDTRSLTPSQHELLKSRIHGNDIFAEITNAERIYLEAGGNKDGMYDRRKKVQSLLGSRRSATAFRLEDFRLGDDTDLWEPAFDVLSEMATHIVGVVEDYAGESVWELVFLYHRQSHVHDSLWILKKVYDDEEVQREKYDNSKAASRLGALEEAIEDRVVRWRTEEDLEEAVEEIQ